MFLDSRIADLSDKELENLHGNAIRLAQAGTPAQRTEAERLLPIIGVELEKRTRDRAAALADARLKRRDAAAATRKRKAAEKAAAAAEPEPKKA
jgi:hypothetical protein